MVDIPPFTKYKKCRTCNGSGWKQEKGGYSLITCPVCLGKKKLPLLHDGRWIKKKEDIPNIQDILRRG